VSYSSHKETLIIRKHVTRALWEYAKQVTRAIWEFARMRNGGNIVFFFLMNEIEI